MDKETFNELAMNLKSEEDVSEMTRVVTKVAMERALEIEMEEHLREKSHGRRKNGNSRSGYTAKTLKTDTAEIPLEIPRDRNAGFEPQLIEKNQRRSSDLDSKILSLYAKGMSTRDIAETFKEMYDVDVSHTLISKVTEGVMDRRSSPSRIGRWMLYIRFSSWIASLSKSARINVQSTRASFLPLCNQL